MDLLTTPEQRAAVAAFVSGSDLAVHAYAGSGKTSTLVLMGQETKRRGLYLAFNRITSDDAKKRFPATVKCSTIHGLAFGRMIGRYGEAKMTDKLNGSVVADALGLSELALSRDVLLTQRGLGFLAADTVRRFCYSDDDKLDREHFYSGDLMARLPPSVYAKLADVVFGVASRLWPRMLDKHDPVPLGFDGYVKAWALERPSLATEFVLLDEAQDTNGVVLGLLSHQQCQRVFVGDRHQQLYDWRGATNAMSKLDTGKVARLSQSFRFGNDIAKLANRTLALLDETVPLVGNASRPSFVGDIGSADAIICRSNAVVIRELFDLIEAGAQPAVAGGVGELVAFCGAAKRLMAGQPADHGDLVGFPSWEEVRRVCQKPEGADLRVLVRLVDQRGPDKLAAMLRSLPSEADADVTVSTGHKAKGREWGRVRLADDFLPRVSADPKNAFASDGELRVLYVAATRAMSALEVSADTLGKLDALEVARARNGLSGEPEPPVKPVRARRTRRAADQTEHAA